MIVIVLYINLDIKFNARYNWTILWGLEIKLNLYEQKPWI